MTYDEIIAKATPRPWHERNTVIRNYLKVDGNVETKQQADFEFALIAVNAHEALVETLETIAGLAVGNGDVCEIIARRARAALALARGEIGSELGHGEGSGELVKT